MLDLAFIAELSLLNEASIIEYMEGIFLKDQLDMLVMNCSNHLL